MRYSISYKNSTPVNIEGFISLIEEHTELFNSYFGNDWAYTGSSAVILYANQYLPEEIETLSPPNDIDILLESRQPISNKRIGQYDTKVQTTIERSSTYVNSMNQKSIDITIVPKLKKSMINIHPVLDLGTLLDDYTDNFSGYREKDLPKIEILNKIKKLLYTQRDTVENQAAEREEFQKRFGNTGRSLF